MNRIPSEYRPASWAPNAGWKYVIALRCRAGALWLATACLLSGLGAACKTTPSDVPLPPKRVSQVPARPLKAPEDFAGLATREDRARANFLEATRVMFHPRCKNCHPAGDVPAQGDESRGHDPPALRGPDDHGPPGMECTSCHQERNQELARVPGAPKWALAPIQMAWMNRTPQMLCEQLKDPKRNGNKDLAQIVAHVAHDELVAWAWAPGHGREPAPGSQAQFAALMAAWVENGASCPGPQQGTQR